MKSIAIVLSLVGLLSACQIVGLTGNPEPTLGKQRASIHKADLGLWGVSLDGMDTSVLPGDSFFHYVNGRWLNDVEIPSDKSTYGTREHLIEQSSENVAQIVKELSLSESKPGTLAQKVGDFYSSFKDVEGINAQGLTPINELLEEIASVKSLEEALPLLASVRAKGLVQFMVLPNPADATTNTAFVMQAGLSMPGRDYYLSDDAQFVEFRVLFKRYVESVLTAAPWDVDPEAADALYALEEKIASSHWVETENRKMEKIYNPMTISQLSELSPQLDWAQYFSERGIYKDDTVVVMQPSALQGIAHAFNEVELQTLKNYLAFQVINRYNEYLPENINELHFSFFKKSLRGIPEEQSREDRGLELLNNDLGSVIGKLYVERHFPESSKDTVNTMVSNILWVMKNKLENNKWMDEPTRKQALTKLATMEVRIGYPESWTDYSTLSIKKNDALGNAMRINSFKWEKDLKDFRTPVDRGVWLKPPQLVKANNMPMLNQLTFHAGMLQAPYFDPKADAAVNYGAIGVVIAHEISHGYDDQGRKFDEAGRIRDWWSEHSAELFNTKSQRLVEQFNQYSPVEGMHMNGEMTLGENIADLAGVELAFEAFQRHKMMQSGDEELGDFSSNQRFFLAYAQMFREKTRQQRMVEKLLKDPHSPAELRVNGILKNVDAWYETFQIAENSAMYLAPEQRVSVW